MRAYWCALFIFLSISFCTGYIPYPNPVTHPEACGREHSSQSWICDPDKLLTQQEADLLERALALMYNEVRTQTCPGKEGYQMAIALVNQMSKYGYPGSLDGAQTFAKDLHDSWGVGFEECQNGIVMLLALGDRHMYISTGRETRKLLTDSYADTVIERMKPYLKQGEYYKALAGGVQNIREILSTGKLSWTFGEIMGYLFMGVIISAVVIGTIIGCVRQQKYSQCKKKLTKIEKKRAQELAEKFNSPHCPICLEDFPTDKAAQKEKVTLLRCGHKFCTPCLAQWQRTNTSCPVCRDREEKQSTGQSEEYTHEMSTIPFELAILRSQYPTFIQTSMIRRWSSPSYTGSFVTDPAFVATSPAASSSRSSSSSSSSSRWGGGSSGGGGGSGGSW